MQTKLLLLILLLQHATLSAQVNENFSDGDFTANPLWTGNAGDWIVNPNGQLQSNNMVANSSFYITTPSTLATATQWEFWVRLAFNTSSANYVDVYLTASASNLSLSSTSGYFVRIGNTQDETALYRKDANGTITKIIDGIDGVTNSSDVLLKIKVVRSSTNEFTLLRDATGTGGNYINEGTVVDATYTTSAFFGFFVKQSTSSFFQKHYIDDIEVKTYSPDIIPPTIQSLSTTSPTGLDVLFSESVDLASSETINNYNASNGLGNAATAQRDAANSALVHLTFNTAFSSGVVHTLTINGVKDVSGNVINNGTGTFSFYILQRYDVVMDEIMADPTPQTGLPSAEFIELKNVSGRSLNLQGWKITTATSSSGLFPNYTLPADSFVVLTSTANAALFTPLGKVLAIPAFPSLTNEGTVLTLLSKEGKTIHAVEYSDSWYNNPVKKEGGWTLEMIDTKNPCTGSGNWKASTDVNGGTPGRKNSVDAVNEDVTPPQLLRTYSQDSTTIIAIFNEPLDSSSAATSASYSLPNNTILLAAPQPPLYNQVVLKLASALQKRVVDRLLVSGIQDCKGNAIGAFNKANAGVAENAQVSDVVINEILFNPNPGGYDYVEVYNRSDKIVDAGAFYLGNKNAGVPGSLKKWSSVPLYLFPGDYLVLTEDETALKNNYMVKNPEFVLSLPSFPSFPDDKGTVVLTNAAGTIIDEVSYEDNWHFALISNAEGVALERINPDGVSQNRDNWHSAASTAGYGTPTYKNSQYLRADNQQAAIDILPKLFSPDNDGYDDVTTINYNVKEKGYVANITIFDAGGRPVRYLVKNAILGWKGSWTWDGLDEKNQKLPVGTYLVFTEFFNLQGRKEQFKNTVVLARKLN